MTYAEAVDFLKGRQETRWKFGLSRIEGLMAGLGRPQDAFPAVHVAGTNGKGSFCALLAGALRAAGYRVGLYTSPHLIRPNERIRVDGRPIPDADFGRALGAAKDAETEVASYFELVTAAAFQYFRERRVDAAVVEVGLGGRLDATNVLEHPRLSVITSIGRDHMNILGESLSSIAEEKAGILKRGVPCLCGGLAEEPLAAIRGRARELGAPLTVHRCDLRTTGVDWERGVQELESPDGRRCSIRLLGDAAAGNASLARAACAMLEGRGLRVPEEAVARGLEGADWPGRFQVLRVRGRTLILDGAHNEPAIEAFLSTWRRSPWSRQDAVFMLAMLNDKDYRGMLRSLAPHARGFIATRSESPRSLAPEALAAAARESGCAGVGTASSAEEALDAWLDSGAQVGVACGSLYLVGALLGRLQGVAA